MECDQYFSSQPFVVLNVDKFVGRFQMRSLTMQNLLEKKENFGTLDNH